MNPGQFTTVDVSSYLPALKRRKGLTHWKVATQPEGSKGPIVYHESYESYCVRVDKGEERERDKDRGKRLPASTWPPSNAEALGLENW
jgi:hypothetical protein